MAAGRSLRPGGNRGRRVQIRAHRGGRHCTGAAAAEGVGSRTRGPAADGGDDRQRGKARHRRRKAAADDGLQAEAVEWSGARSADANRSIDPASPRRRPGPITTTISDETKSALSAGHDVWALAFAGATAQS